MDYARYQKIVAAQIKKYGQLVTFHFRKQADYDPIAGTSSPEFVDEESHAVLVRPDEKSFKTGTVQHGDAALIIDGRTLTTAPNENDLVTVAGERWRIISVSRVSPADLTIIYKVYIRQA